MIDTIRLRKLENGYTVKYHVTTGRTEDGKEQGFSKELYVNDVSDMGDVICELIAEHLENTP